MKYWVYKDSRILGPFDKNAVADLPGLDASTLVCAGESATGDWRPAGDVADLAALPLEHGTSWTFEGPSSSSGLLDRLQIDAAGLIGDDEFPGAAGDLFQDAEMKRAFGDLLSPRSGADEAELRRARDRSVELTAQLELLYKRVAELEAGQTNLVHRLAEKEMELRGRPVEASAPAPVASPAPIVLPVPPVPTLTVEPPAPIMPSAAIVPPEPVVPPVPPSPPVPLVSSAPAAPPAPPPVPPPAALPPEPPPMPPFASAPSPLAPPFLPVLPKVVSEPPAPVAPAAAELPISEPPPKKIIFGRKTFKVFPTVKSFKVVAAEDDPVVIEPSVQEPLLVAPPVSIPVLLKPVSPEPSSETIPPVQVPAAAPPPPVTLSTAFPAHPEAENPPVTSFFSPQLNFSGEPAKEETAAPPATAVFDGVVEDMAGASSTEDAIARLAKPAPESTIVPPRAPRSNKPFLIGAAALVLVMAVAGALFFRHPKDLKQMAALDDGRASVGAEATDDASRMPMVKPKMAAPPDVPVAPAASSAAQPAATPAVEAPQAASQAKLDAAVAAVKDFPLDGERGTVAGWLQYSYSASPDAGRESWSASETSDKTYLVEYRFTPSGHGDEVHYLFEVDMDRGFVIGKNLDAKSVLSGGSGVAEPKAKPKAKTKAKKTPTRKRVQRPKKKAVKRADDDVSPKEVPLLPLPTERELRPPAEDDGAFSADTVNTGL